MDLFWQINPEEMLSALMVTTFLILLATSIVVVSSMVMFPLIDLAFKTKATSTPRPAQVETGLTADAQLSGRLWLALRSDFLRPDALLVDVNYWLKTRNVEGYRNYDSPRERITPLIVRLPVPKGSEGAPPGAGSSVKRVA